MGFTIETYQLLGLPSLPNIYVTIKGSYAVKKQLIPAHAGSGTYIITFTTYFQASPEDPVITQKDMCFSIQALPNPAVLYLIIYDFVKGQLDPYYMSNQQTLTFTDD
jgi:hypothetical protein